MYNYRYYKRIRELREDNDLTQKQVAEHFDMHLTQYRRYETGENEPPVYFIVSLCHFYNVSADYLLEITDEYKTMPPKKRPSK